VFNNYADDMRKMQIVFSNPALLKVFSLQCDLFSLGKFYVYRDGKDIGDDPMLQRLANPNPMQSGKQLAWDLMFWKMVGTANLYIDSDIIEKTTNKFYVLENPKIQFPSYFDKEADKMIFSAAKEEEIRNTIITYRYADGTSYRFKLGRLSIFTDLSSSSNWYKSRSRIDALVKIIANSEASLDSENINIRYSGKFLVAGTADPNDVTKIPLSDQEKQDIRWKVNDREPVHPVKSMIDIKRFVENMGQLKLNEKYLNAYFLIGNMYGIPKDVLEAYNSGTFENQEKARGAHVSYTLQPFGDELCQSLTRRFGYENESKELIMSWDHLPFMQVFEKDRAVTNKINAETFVHLLKNGVPISEANEFLDLNFTREAPVEGAGSGK